MVAWERYLADREPQYLSELLDFLRIPSISALPDHAPDVQRAAVWVADRLQIHAPDEFFRLQSFTSRRAGERRRSVAGRLGAAGAGAAGFHGCGAARRAPTR